MSYQICPYCGYDACIIGDRRNYCLTPGCPNEAPEEAVEQHYKVESFTADEWRKLLLEYVGCEE